jgi:hypothetical protein
MQGNIICYINVDYVWKWQGCSIFSRQNELQNEWSSAFQSEVAGVCVVQQDGISLLNWDKHKNEQLINYPLQVVDQWQFA